MISLLSRGAAVPLVLQRQFIGIGQIYLQDTPAFGAMLLLCLYLSAPAMAAGCVIGVCTASVSAWALDLPQASRDSGLYSFNGALTGIGLCALYRVDAMLLIWTVALSALTVALTQALIRLRIPPLTFPFVLMMWLTAAIVPDACRLESVPSPLMAAVASGLSIADGELPVYLFSCLGQVAFVAAPSGMLLWMTMAKRDWRLAVTTLLAAGAAWLTVAATAVVWPHSGIAAQGSGAGVNSVLATLALARRQCAWPKKMAAATLSIAMAILFGRLSLPYFTLPFIVAVWFLDLDVRERLRRLRR